MKSEKQIKSSEVISGMPSGDVTEWGSEFSISIE